MKNITIQDAVNHIEFLLTDVEKMVLAERINELIHNKNHFYSYAYIDFYYNNLSFTRGDKNSTGLNSERYYFVKIKLGSPYKNSEPIGWIDELLPIPDINLNVGMLIADGEHFFHHKESNKYGITKPPYKIVSITDGQMKMELEYVYRKKTYKRYEIWDLSETKINIYRNKYFIKQFKENEFITDINNPLKGGLFNRLSEDKYILFKGVLNSGMEYKNAIRGTEEQFNNWKINCIKKYFKDVLVVKNNVGVDGVLHKIGFENVKNNIEHDYGFKPMHDELIDHLDLIEHWML